MLPTLAILNEPRHLTLSRGGILSQPISVTQTNPKLITIEPMGLDLPALKFLLFPFRQSEIPVPAVFRIKKRVRITTTMEKRA
jgi:hypothetical protein